MNNKVLAVVGQVVETNPIPGADRIHQALVDCGDSGRWSAVVPVEICRLDMVTAFLQDAVLPKEDPTWAFMEKHKWRIKMARFKGVPSECLVMASATNMPIGTDLTGALGVTKHEKPIPAAMAGNANGSFPLFIPKTDEPNFQTVPHLVNCMATDDWHITHKADGTSCTTWTDADGALHVASRNWELYEFTPSGASNVYWKTARKYGAEKLPSGAALQFEIVGPGIQGNPMGLSEVEARAFSLYDYTAHKYLPAAQLEEVARSLNMPLAVREDRHEKRTYTSEELRKMAEIRYPNGKHGEGIVVCANDSSWSFKVINLLYKD